VEPGISQGGVENHPLKSITGFGGGQRKLLDKGDNLKTAWLGERDGRLAGTDFDPTVRLESWGFRSLRNLSSWDCVLAGRSKPQKNQNQMGTDAQPVAKKNGRAGGRQGLRAQRWQVLRESG